MTPAAVRDAMRAGARGYVLKHEEAAELRAAIRAVAAGNGLGKYAQANRAAPTKLDLYHRAVEDGHLPSAP